MKEKNSSLGGPAEALVTGASHLVKPALLPALPTLPQLTEVNVANQLVHINGRIEFS